MNWIRYFDALVRGEQWAARRLIWWVVVVISVGIAVAVCGGDI